MPLVVLSRSATEPPNSLPRVPQQCSGRSAAVLPLEAVTNLQQSPSVTQRRNFHFVSMATAKFKQHFHAPHSHRLFRSNSSNVVNEPPVDQAQRQKEKDFLCCYECNQAPLSPHQISDAPHNKEVGTASKNLRVGDFELIKTIGTGVTHYRPLAVNLCLCYMKLMQAIRHLCKGVAHLSGRFAQGRPESLCIENPAQDRQYDPGLPECAHADIH